MKLKNFLFLGTRRLWIAWLVAMVKHQFQGNIIWIANCVRMGIVINDNKNNGNIEQMLFESFLSHRWTLSFTARSIKVAQFYLVFCLSLRVFIVQGLRKYESIHIPRITSRLDSILPLNWTWWLECIATNCQNLMQNCINFVFHDISSLHANASRLRSWKMFPLLSLNAVIKWHKANLENDATIAWFPKIRINTKKNSRNKWRSVPKAFDLTSFHLWLYDLTSIVWKPI